jgi:hypothetical protein
MYYIKWDENLLENFNFGQCRPHTLHCVYKAEISSMDFRKKMLIRYENLVHYKHVIMIVVLRKSV